MRKGKRRKVTPDKSFSPKELTSSELNCEMVRDPRDEPLPTRAMWRSEAALRAAGIILMAGGMLYTMAGMAHEATGVLDQVNLPNTGEFSIHPDHEGEPLGQLVPTDKWNRLLFPAEARIEQPVVWKFC